MHCDSQAGRDFVWSSRELKDIKIYGFIAQHKKKKLCGMADIYVENIGETN